MDLPDEILLIIFGFLDHHRHIHPLLLVSRSFNRLAEPLLYREINFNGDTSHDYATPRVRQLTQTIASQQDSRLANYVKSFLTLQSDFLHDILPVLPNLRRLNIFLVHPRHCYNFGTLLSPSVRLTHLRMGFCAEMALLRHFLESQPTLEYLDVADIRIMAPLTLSPHALSRLRTFGSQYDYMRLILTGRDIHHLSIVPNTIIHPANGFPTVHTLHISRFFSQLRYAIPFACLFPSLRYLAIDLDHSDTLITNTMTLLHPLAVTNVEYLSIQLTRSEYTKGQLGNPARYPSHFTACFVEAVPTLRVLDVGWIEHHHGFQGLRFTAGVPDPVEFTRPKEDYASWALWWENRGLEANFD